MTCTTMVNIQTVSIPSARNGYPGTRIITRYLGTRSEPGYPNTCSGLLLPVCCPLNSALMAANLEQYTMYMTNLVQIYMQTANITV